MFHWMYEREVRHKSGSLMLYDLKIKKIRLLINSQKRLGEKNLLCPKLRIQNLLLPHHKVVQRPMQLRVPTSQICLRDRVAAKSVSNMPFADCSASHHKMFRQCIRGSATTQKHDKNSSQPLC